MLIPQLPHTGKHHPGNHRLKSYFPLKTAIFSHRSCLRKNLHPFEKIIHPPSVAIDGKIRYIYSRHRTVIA